MGRNLVNIGKPEKPIFVPEDAMFSPQSVNGNSWWEKVATGSVTLPEKGLQRTLKISGKFGGSNGCKQS